MMRIASTILYVALAACGGKSTAKPQEAAPTTGSAAAAGSDNGEQHGIGQAEVAQMACYEDCLTNGPQGATDWSKKSEDDKKAICEPECKDAGAGLPSDQPADRK